MIYHKKAFSLVELSLVIAIIALLAAGVSGASRLIDQSKQRAVIKESETYRTAVVTFRLTYKALPGDIIDAASYWSACTDESGNTCNGDGDGFIETSGDVSKEGYRAWQHLGLANLIKGSYTGLGSSTTIGINTPKSSYYDMCFNFNYWSSRNSFMLGGVSNACDSTTLTPEQAYNIDSKGDDGNSSTGLILGKSSPCSVSGIYTLSSETKDCYLSFGIDE